MTTTDDLRSYRRHAAAFSFAVAAGMLFCVATARGDERPGLDKAAFHAALQDGIDGIKETCKLDLPVTSNFEAIDLDAWGAGGAGKSASGPPRRMLHMISATCVKAIDAIDSLCRSNGDREAWRPVVAREIKGVRCQFTGAQPRKKGESRNVWIRHNLLFSKGVLTVLMSPELEDLGDNALAVVMAGLADKPGAPAVPKDLLKTGENGEQCQRLDDCGSGVCAGGVCASCSAKAKCRAGSQCDEGVCRTADEMKEIDARRAEPKSEPAAPSAHPVAKGLAHGRMCSKSSECSSGACQMENRTRGRCK